MRTQSIRQKIGITTLANLAVISLQTRPANAHSDHFQDQEEPEAIAEDIEKNTSEASEEDLNVEEMGETMHEQTMDMHEETEESRAASPTNISNTDVEPIVNISQPTPIFQSAAALFPQPAESLALLLVTAPFLLHAIKRRTS